MAFLDRGDSAGEFAARIVVCSTALSSARPQTDEAVFDDIVIECATLRGRERDADFVVTIKMTRDEALQLCSDITQQLKTLPILKPKSDGSKETRQPEFDLD